MIESLPTFSDKDLQVVHRKTEKGVWKDELWTKRDFEAFEIMLGPYSSALKDTHLMAAADCQVTLPKVGPGAHPEKLRLAFDGRGRTSMAEVGMKDSNQHLGSLFWLVGRTSKASEANLALENSTFEAQVVVPLPVGPKRRKVSPAAQWASHGMPSVPVLVSKKAIKAQAQLLMYLPEDG